MAERNNNVRVLFSDDEKLMIRHLAELEGLTVADVVRQMTRAAFERACPDTSAALAMLRRKDGR